MMDDKGKNAGTRTTGPTTGPTAPPDPEAVKARVRDELMTLEYPRHLHKADGAYLRVENETEARAAVADGWCIAANSPRVDDPGKVPIPVPVK